LDRLIEFINQCFQKSSVWTIHAINEKNLKWFSFTITFHPSSEFELECPSNIPYNTLSEILWCSDLLQSPSEESLDRWLDSTDPFNTVKALAPDTNLIIRRFFPNYLGRKRKNPYESLSLLIILSRSINFELHTMRPFKYGRPSISSNVISFNSNLLEFFKQTIDNWPALGLLWNIREDRGLSSQLRQLNNIRGRIGLRGTFEIDSLRKWAPVLVVKPIHILHSPKVIEDTYFLNAIHDSLIRYEVDFFHQNISIPLLFLSNDKDQCKAAQQEGLDAIHIQQPSSNNIQSNTLNQKLNSSTIYKLILELLTRSPALRLTSIDNHHHLLSWTWRGKSMEDISQQRIRVIMNNHMRPFSIQP